MSRVDFEAGYKACERGENIQMALAGYDRLKTETPWFKLPLYHHERDQAINMASEEVSDSARDIAVDMLAGEDAASVIMYADPDATETCRVLTMVKTGEVTVEFLELHDEDGSEGYKNLIEFAKRMRLIENDQVSELGREYIQRYGD